MLKFITEEDLRALYRKEAFDFYQVSENQRLTPGGRQYLLDKKIEIRLLDKNKKISPSVSNSNIYKLKSIDMDFLSLANELLGKSTEFTYELLESKKILKNMIDSLEGKNDLIKVKEVEGLEYIYPDENCLYNKNGKYIFHIKKIIFDLLFSKDLFTKEAEICKNLDFIVNKLEKLIHHMMEEL